MRIRRRHLPFLVLGVVSLGVLLFRGDVALRAEDASATEGRQFDLRSLPVSAKVSTERNRVIDCSTNPAYGKGAYRDYMASISGPNHANTTADCQMCHKSRRPTVGVGDRPLTSFASFALANYSDTPQKYSLYAGDQGQGQWVEYEIAPKKVQRFSWRYSNPADPSSPVYWLYHDGATLEVQPLATPNKDIGSLYYFSASGDNPQVRVSKAADQPYRAGR